jgi:peptidoglycan/LPS O-acetylase OafA/YrhL
MPEPQATARRRLIGLDGLRAICIALVMLFHLDIREVRGGFLGVDVFFVLSGFLIARQIQDEIDAGRFSILSFWLRRLRRLLPAMLICFSVTMAVGYVLLANEDVHRLSEMMMAAIVSSSNFLLASQAGYFDNQSIDKPLLHTWSLAIEMQFYFLFPFILVGLSFLSRKRILSVAILAALAACSFAAMIWASGNAPVRAFYFPQYRFWELLIGACIGLLAVRPKDQLADVMVATGLIAIFILALVTSGSSTKAQISVALTVAASAMLCWASMATNSRLAGVLDLLAPVGRWSYSIYLWHFPILVFWVYAFSRPKDAVTLAGLAAAMLAVGAVSYHLIENPIRLRRWLGSNRAFLSVFGGLAAVLMLVCAAIDSSETLPWRPANDAKSAVSALRVEANCSGGACKFGKADAEPSFLLWGDSHARHLAQSVDRISHALNISGAGLVNGGCGPIFDVVDTRDGCQKTARRALETVQTNDSIKLVMIASMWRSYPGSVAGRFTVTDASGNVIALDKAGYLAKFRQSVERLLALGKKVIIIAQVPKPPCHTIRQLHLAKLGLDQPVKCKLAMDKDTKASAADYALFEELESVPEIQVIYPNSVFCWDGICQTSENGYSFYADGGHLSRWGAEKLEPLITQAMVKALAKTEP